MAEAARFRAGVIFGLIAYLWWGGVPLYFNQLKGLPAGEILAGVGLLGGTATAVDGWDFAECHERNVEALRSL